MWPILVRSNGTNGSTKFDQHTPLPFVYYYPNYCCFLSCSLIVRSRVPNPSLRACFSPLSLCPLRSYIQLTSHIPPHAMHESLKVPSSHCCSLIKLLPVKRSSHERGTPTYTTDVRRSWGPPPPTTTKFLLLDFIFIFSRQILIHESYKIERAEHQNKILYFCSASHKHKRKIPPPSILFGEH